MRHQKRRAAHESKQKYALTTYDTELARLAHERNTAYTVLDDVHKFALTLVDGEYSNVADYLLEILIGESND